MLARFTKASGLNQHVRLLLAVVLAAAAVAAGTVRVNAQWPMGCMELNDIVERHLGNEGNVGLYQRVFGEHAEQACQIDHQDDVAGTFAWALVASDLSNAKDDSSSSDVLDEVDGWPETCVELNDIVEGQLRNDLNVGIYQRVFGDDAEIACRQDHADDIPTVFAWATPCDVPPTTAAGHTAGEADTASATMRERPHGLHASGGAGEISVAGLSSIPMAGRRHLEQRQPVTRIATKYCQQELRFRDLHCQRRLVRRRCRLRLSEHL